MAGVTTDSASWVRVYHPSPAPKARVVCFPHAGGSASFFHPVSSALRPDIEVLAIQYPGRQDRRAEAPLTDIGTLADRVLDALRPHLVREPRPAFFGHSMGATVAFEVAVRMRREGLAPTVLVASGRRAPSERRSEDVHLRDDAGLVAEIRKLSGTDSRLLDDEEMLHAILPAVRADYRAIERYVGASDAVVDCPVEVFVGDTDEQVTAEEADAWRRHTSGAFAVHTFRGGHFYLTTRAAETIERLAATVRAHA
ncbi:thioesterase [Streptomyces pilosus]|uniref:thioesterase II family protein n=1 Tax=Streptomyces pilosus TaxID=28893 RepID=UPI001672F160|nr:alpha/beta fold hydrolase [Streptomyces pilosus]GGV53515.1 thioesterase [Streptomyces pilosus]